MKRELSIYFRNSDLLKGIVARNLMTSDFSPTGLREPWIISLNIFDFVSNSRGYLTLKTDGPASLCSGESNQNCKLGELSLMIIIGIGYWRSTICDFVCYCSSKGLGSFPKFFDLTPRCIIQQKDVTSSCMMQWWQWRFSPRIFIHTPWCIMQQRKLTPAA